jgi:adenine-specific DNA-methyltransferase
MEKLDLQTPNITDENVQKISNLFPNCVTEAADGTTQVVDFDLLKQELSSNIVEGNQERYQLTWPGKAESLVTANTPINKTLRPAREESKDFDNTENLYIEGDNLEVLKLLQETYLGKIKMIYIDPPYNTGKDFVYKDNFTQDKAEYDEESGNVDDEGGRLVSNPDSNGRYHSDWLSMMYPRLKLARNLLKDDGVIFISIDDNESHNLRKLCDEIFGENRFVSSFPWRKRTAKSDVPFGISQDYELVLCYSKSDSFKACKEGKGRKYHESDDLPGNPWRTHDMTKQTTASERPNSFFDMVNPKNGDTYPANPNNVWRITKDTFDDYYANNRIIFPGDYDFLSISKPVLRYFKKDDEKKAGDMFGYIAVSTKLPDDIGMTQSGTKDFNELFNERIFTFPKPVSLIEYFVKITTQINKDVLILDLFSGSATTAHAVMRLNAEDRGNRKFIMVQIPEVTGEKSEAHKAGYKTIAEIGKERIRRAGEKIKTDNADKEGINDLDIGFRVLKVDSSNIEDVHLSPDNTKQNDILNLFRNIKEGRTDEDLLFMVLLDWGIDLSVKIERREVAGKVVYFADDNFLAACFEKNIDEDFVRTLVGNNPLKVVLQDNGFANDSVKINAEQIFKQADIEVKVI